jgi:hypothetical protein
MDCTAVSVLLCHGRQSRGRMSMGKEQHGKIEAITVAERLTHISKRSE